MTLHIFHVYIRVALCTEIIERSIRFFLRFGELTGDYFVLIDTSSSTATDKEQLPTSMKLGNKSRGSERVLLFDGVNTLIKNFSVGTAP